MSGPRNPASSSGSIVSGGRPIFFSTLRPISAAGTPSVFRRWHASSAVPSDWNSPATILGAIYPRPHLFFRLSSANSPATLDFYGRILSSSKRSPDDEPGDDDQRHGDDAPDREDRGEWQADPIPQRTDSERSDPVAELIESDHLSCHHGGEVGKLIPAEADAQWQKREHARPASPKTTIPSASSCTREET